MIAIIGGGNLGTAIAEGLLESEFCPAAEIYLTRRNVEKLSAFTAKGITTTADNREAVKNCRIVILAIKPFQISAVVDEIRDLLSTDHVLISVVTGVSLTDIQQMCSVALPVFRAMPNTAIAIKQSMTCISAALATEEHIKTVSDIFNRLGKTAFINDSLMDAATVLGACGTAYAMRYIRANIQGGIEIGFDSATASLIAEQTVKGAAEMLLLRGSHPEQEIDKVTTPKGCTIAGLNEMEHRGFSSSLIKGIASSYNKIVKG